jgi:hypothetical protein
MKPPRYFVSYSRCDAQQVRVIGETLHAHGIEIWQDINNLGKGIAESSIREAIAKETDGLILFITAESVASDFIKAVELHEADARIRRDPSFCIIPIFCIPIKDAASALSGCLTVPVSSFNGVKVEEPRNTQNLIEAANRVALLIMDSVIYDNAAPFHVGLSSKQKVVGQLHSNLNFLSHFEANLPPTEVWSQRIAPAINAVKNNLVSKGIQALRVTGHCHLSLGCLMGYVFRRPTAFRIETVQNSDGTASVWSTHGKSGANPLKVVELPGEIGSRDLLVVLNLYSSDIGSVLKCAATHGLKRRATITLNPPRYPYLITSNEAVAIARDLSATIKELHARYSTSNVHLFLAVPLGLSLLIGYDLNACGRVQCYEFDNKNSEYSPSCVLV